MYCVNIMVGGKERGMVVIFSFAQSLLECISGHGEMGKQTNRTHSFIQLCIINMVVGFHTLSLGGKVSFFPLNTQMVRWYGEG